MLWPLQILVGKASSIVGGSIICGYQSHQHSVICDSENDKTKYLFSFGTPILFSSCFQETLLCLNHAPGLVKWVTACILG